MFLMAAAIRGRRANRRETLNGLCIAVSMVVVVALMSLAGCDVPGAGNLDVENEGSSMVGEGGVAGSNGEIEVPEPKASEETEKDNVPEVPENDPDTMISKGYHRAPAATVPSDGVDRGDDRLDSDAETRLIEEQMRLRGRIDTLDSQLKAFDINPPSRAARESDSRGRPEAIERRLDVERRTLEARQRRIRRELRNLRDQPTPILPGSGSRGTSSPSLFGGSGMQ